MQREWKGREGFIRYVMGATRLYDRVRVSMPGREKPTQRDRTCSEMSM